VIGDSISCDATIGCAKKVIPSEKFDISGIVAKVYRGFRPHILQISLEYVEYNYLNLNAHFSK